MGPHGGWAPPAPAAPRAAPDRSRSAAYGRRPRAAPAPAAPARSPARRPPGRSSTATRRWPGPPLRSHRGPASAPRQPAPTAVAARPDVATPRRTWPATTPPHPPAPPLPHHGPPNLKQSGYFSASPNRRGSHPPAGQLEDLELGFVRASEGVREASAH